MNRDEFKEACTALINKPFPKKTFFYFVFKRVFDMFLALIFLCAALPFLLLIAIVISIDSPGSIIIRQKRVGYKGVEFVMYKFRTMRSEAVLYELAPTSSSDSRITRVGKVLRRTSLDELPQLINVIGGSMSMVGPRPEMPTIVTQYKDWQRRRFDAKPGLTGFWQVSGRKDLPLSENIEYDLYYIHHRSLFFDAYVLIKTVVVVFGLKGAY